jgi:acetyl-CoA carboxylase biotin carboxyl carrier protein
MDIRKIKKLIEMVEESDVAELEIHEGDDSVRITRHGARTALAPQLISAAPLALAAPAPTPELAPEAGEPVQRGKPITSPMVGTFYSSSSPDSPPFVEVGQRVEEGQTVCIIEAMKILNQIEAEISGVVVAILVDNAQPIEFDQTLMLIE